MKDALNTAGGKQLRLAVVLIAILPAVFGWITQTYDQIQPLWQNFARFFSLPVSFVEIAVIGIAAFQGFRPSDELARMPKLLMGALALVVAIAFYTMVFVANADMHSNVRTMAWVIHLLFGLAVANLASAQLAYFRPMQVWTWLCWGFVLYFVAMLVFVVRMPDPRNFDWRSFYFGVINIRQTGFYSGVGFAMAIAVAALSPKTSRAFVFSLIAAGMIGISFWNATRSGIVSAVAAVVLAVPIAAAFRAPRNIGLSVLAVLCGFGLAFVSPPPADTFNVSRYFSDDSSKPGYDVSSARFQIWKMTIAGLKERPLLGHGESQFKQNVQVSQGYNHPHNAFLQMTYQWGIFGALAFFALFFWAWFQVARVAREWPELGVPAFMVIAAMFTNSMIEGGLYHPWPVMMMAFSAGIAIGGARALKAERQTTG